MSAETNEPPVCPPVEETNETMPDITDGTEIVIDRPGLIIGGGEDVQPERSTTTVIDVNEDKQVKKSTTMLNDVSEDSPTEKLSTERNEALRNQILRELNGGQCFIFESGSTVHLTITRDVNEHHSMVVNKVHGTHPAAGPSKEEASTAKSNRSPGIFSSIFASMRKTASDTKDTSTKDTSTKDTSTKDTCTKDNKKEPSEVPVIEDDHTVSVDGQEMHTPEPNLQDEHPYPVSCSVPYYDGGHDERIGGRRQIKYDGYMRPYPGIEEYRYHVDSYYVPVKIFLQFQQDGSMFSEPIDLHNLFSPKNDDYMVQSVVVVAEYGKTALVQHVLHSYSVRNAVFAEFPCDTTLLFRVNLSSSVTTQLKSYLNRFRERYVILVIDDYNPANKSEEQQLQKLLSKEHAIHDAEVGALSVMVILTTKPFENNKVLESCDRRVELGTFGENEVLEFTDKYKNEFKIEEVNDFVQRIKELTGVPMKEVNPLVLLTFCLASRRVEEFDFDNILLHCKYMLSWRCQKRAWGKSSNFLVRALSFRRMPTFEEFKLNVLKAKYCEEAKRIMQESRFYLPTPSPDEEIEKASLNEE